MKIITINSKKKKNENISNFDFGYLPFRKSVSFKSKKRIKKFACCK